MGHGLIWEWELFKRKAATIVGKGLDAAGKLMEIKGDKEET